MKRLSLLEGEINSLTTLKKLTNQKLNRDAQNERSPQGRKKYRLGILILLSIHSLKMSKNVPHTCIIVGPGTIKNDKEQLLLNGPLHAEGHLKSSTTILKRSRKSEIMICIWKNISVGLISINFKLNRLKRLRILFKILSRYRFKKKYHLITSRCR